MEFCIFTEPQQGYEYEELLASAQLAERLGFDGWFRSDHYLKMGDHFDGLPGPTDAWTTLAGLSRETERIRLGTLVSSVTYRYPGVLAIQVAQVDRMSGGRAELGLGTGWYGAEHRAYGIPFPEKRFGILEEQLEIVTGLWSTPVGETFHFAGRHYSLEDSPALPKPIQDRIPVIVGGSGAKRTPLAAARFASEYNANFVDDAGVAANFARVREAADSIGRDPDDLKYSVALATVVGEDESEFQRRAAAIGSNPADLRRTNLGGTRAEVEDRLGRLRDLGAERVYVQVIDLADTDHLELIADIVRPFR
ncbi:LLM class F420-dependent oxidoreductase [Herbiconiux sp. L3-i23]|uniref:LLM class F420-dependent oxidoreductase n=1 Tax=Herbiconiux sp. L3-i23 TaxID=2905871 RepID=UPI002067C869|nr:LLM class F420-dependent oxidoreductase [Herbiconiux sp. L3-i23]BDI23262.1 LLM class F420-dependent oxidoreductase [Herbiconiux sp. L3-i23]